MNKVINIHKKQVKLITWLDDTVFYTGYFKSLQSAKNWLSRSASSDTKRLSIGIELYGQYRLLATKNIKDKSWVSYERYKGEYIDVFSQL